MHTASTYMRRYSAPNGGDWSFYAGAAVSVRNAANVEVDGCSFVAPGGNALLFHARVRNSSVKESLFARCGDSAIVAVGTAVYADGTQEMCPVGLEISRNLAHDLGVWGKQQGFLYQALSAKTQVRDNVAFNGPRAAISFTDGFGGGHVVDGNLFFDFVRETSDHGLFNSWDRQPYKTKFGDGSTASTTPAWTSISRNLLINSYRSVWPIDHDDGSAFYKDTSNVLVYGGFKSFLGNNKTAAHNLYLFPDAFEKQFDANFCASVWQPDAGPESWYNNTCVKLTHSPVYGGAVGCNGPQQAVTVTSNNTFFYLVAGADPSQETMMVCGNDNVTLRELQQMGFEEDSRTEICPSVAHVFQLARHLLRVEI